MKENNKSGRISEITERAAKHKGLLIGVVLGVLGLGIMEKETIRSAIITGWAVAVGIKKAIETWFGSDNK